MDFLSTRGANIIDAQGQAIQLRGTCVGGWMNMEDFIGGFAGAEHTLRLEMAQVLGPSRAEFFFDRLLTHFFNESDVAYLKQIGSTVVRLPLNYRHFEDDSAPFVYKEAGFRRLDAALDWCEKHGLYVILDLHAVQGWQNVHWHSDNASRISLFWHDAHYQQRFIGLWQAFARRYRDRAVVAGYNLINEPCGNNQRGDQPWNIYRTYQPDWPRFNHVYRRAVAAIREVDPEHIIFLEGDRYSILFSGLEAPFADNLVYSSHNYTAAGFGPGTYPGTIEAPPLSDHAGPEAWDRARQEAFFLEQEGTVYTKKHQVPLWVGEFGSVYNGPATEVPDRARAMDDQIGIFEAHGTHWTTWTYKDVGVMGLQTLDPQSEYMQRVADFIRRKIELGTDAWMKWLPQTDVKDAAAALSDQIHAMAGDAELDRHYSRISFSQTALCFFAGAFLQPAYAKLFKGLSEVELDRVLSSFSREQCRVNVPLEGIVRKYTGATVTTRS